MGEAFDAFAAQFCFLHGTEPDAIDAWNAANQASTLSVNHTSFQDSYRGTYENARQKVTSVWLGIGLVLYWAAVFAITLVRRFFWSVAIRLSQNRSVMRRRGAFARFLQKNILLPAMFKHDHKVRITFLNGYLSFSLPTRFEGMLIAIYTLLVIVFMITPYTFVDRDPLYSSRWKQMMRYSSDRSGIIATVQIPLFVLFASRNNVLIWLTGWSYATFNTYHRALARISFILLIVHAVTKHIFSASYGGSLAKYYFPLLYFRWGVAALGLMSLMVALAIVRVRLYELFKWMHISCAIGAFICSIRHLDGIGFQQPLWICVGIWVLDVLIRLVRILTFNVSMILPPLQGAHRLAFATIRVYDEEVMQIKVTLPVRWIAKPGQYVYLHASRWFPFGGHPFSVAGASDDGGEGLELCVRCRDGFTKRLCRTLVDRGCSPKYPVTMPVNIEGPYGTSAPIDVYDEGLIFAGGIGITGVLSYVEKMALATRPGEIPKRVRLFWSLPYRGLADPVARRLDYLRHLDGVEIFLFCSREKRPQEKQKVVDIEQAGDSSESTLGFDSGEGSRQGSSESLEPSYSPEDTQVSYNFSAAGDSRSGKNEALLSSRDLRAHHLNPFIDKSPFGDENAVTDTESALEFSLDFEEGPEARLAPTSTPTTKHRNTTHTKRKAHEVSRKPQHQSRHQSRRRDPRLLNAGLLDRVGTKRELVTPMENRLSVTYNSNTFITQLVEARNNISDLFVPGRMDIVQLVQDYMTHSEGSVAVLGCGPAGMMDILCAAVARNLDLAQHGAVDYYEEAFSW